MKYLFVCQNLAGRVVGGAESTTRAGATRRNNRLRRDGQPLRLVEVADLNFLHPHVTGVCKDCGAGTLNNETNPAFVRDEQAHAFRCLRCSSLHLDVVEPEAQ